jgi:hypothetical protein
VNKKTMISQDKTGQSLNFDALTPSNKFDSIDFKFITKTSNTPALLRYKVC